MNHEIVTPTVSLRVNNLPVRIAVRLSAFVSIPRRLIVSARRYTVLKLLFPVIACCLISACSLTLVNKVPPPPEPVAELPEEFAGSGVAGSYEPLEWWKTFADPVLDRVIEAVLASNFDLAEAVARVDQARARERIVKAPAFSVASAFGEHH